MSIPNFCRTCLVRLDGGPGHCDAHRNDAGKLTLRDSAPNTFGIPVAEEKRKAAPFGRTLSGAEVLAAAGSVAGTTRTAKNADAYEFRLGPPRMMAPSTAARFEAASQQMQAKAACTAAQAQCLGCGAPWPTSSTICPGCKASTNMRATQPPTPAAVESLASIYRRARPTACACGGCFDGEIDTNHRRHRASGCETF